MLYTVFKSKNASIKQAFDRFAPPEYTRYGGINVRTLEMIFKNNLKDITVFDYADILKNKGGGMRKGCRICEKRKLQRGKTRKNPVRFVRDHAPHVGAKDLRKLRTLSKRHKLMIPAQTTATSWKTFDPADPPTKVVRIVVDGTHTFDFGMKR